MAIAESDIRSTPQRADSWLAANEELGFDQVYRVYAPMVERLVTRYIRDRSRAEDLVQETFLRAYRAWPAIDTNQPVWPWLSTIAQRVCTDVWRAGNRHGEVACIDPVFPELLPATEGDPTEALFSSMLRDGVCEALAALTPRQRRVLLLRDLHGLRYKEIAKIEGTTVAALRCSLARARASFRTRYLSVAQDRGLSVLLWPVVGPIVQRFRVWGRRTNRIVESALQRVSSLGPMDSLASGALPHLSSGIVALTLVLGSFSPSGSHPKAGSVSDLSTSIASSSPSALTHPAEERGSGPSVPRDRRAPQQGGEQGGEAVPSGTTTPTDAPGALLSTKERTKTKASKRVERATEPNENVQEPEDTRITSFAASPTGDTVFAAGRNRECAAHPECPTVLFRSDDGARSWTRLEADGFDGNTLLLPPAFGAGDDRIFAMGYTGVLQVSEDGGKTFAPAVKGAPSFNGSMAISPGFNSGDPRILIGTSSTLMQYDDDTKSIAPAPYSSLPGSLEPVFATRDLLMVGGRKLNEQRQWGSAVFRCKETVCQGTRFSDQPVTPKLRLAPGFAETGLMYAFTQSALYASVDGGGSFSPLLTPSVDGYLGDLALAEAGQTLVAVVWTVEPNGAEGAYLSTDRGSTWTKVESPLLKDGAKVVRVVGSRVLVGLSHGGLACSPDLGATWGRRC